MIGANSHPSRRPGDYLQHGDDEVEGFKHRLNERLAPVGSQFSGEGVNEDWEIGDTLAQWWRPNFETFMYPFLLGHSGQCYHIARKAEQRGASYSLGRRGPLEWNELESRIGNLFTKGEFQNSLFFGN